MEHLSAYELHPRMVVNANSTRLILTTAIPILEPRADENASVVMAAPDSLEHHAPVTISVRPVIIQIMMVIVLQQLQRIIL